MHRGVLLPSIPCNAHRSHLPTSRLGAKNALVQAAERIQRLEILVHLKQRPVHAWRLFAEVLDDTGVIQLIHDSRFAIASATA